MSTWSAPKKAGSKSATDPLPFSHPNNPVFLFAIPLLMGSVVLIEFCSEQVDQPDSGLGRVSTKPLLRRRGPQSLHDATQQVER
jgi:hypothetical protein